MTAVVRSSEEGPKSSRWVRTGEANNNIDHWKVEVETAKGLNGLKTQIKKCRRKKFVKTFDYLIFFMEI